MCWECELWGMKYVVCFAVVVVSGMRGCEKCVVGGYKV